MPLFGEHYPGTIRVSGSRQTGRTCGPRTARPPEKVPGLYQRPYVLTRWQAKVCPPIFVRTSIARRRCGPAPAMTRMGRRSRYRAFGIIHQASAVAADWVAHAIAPC